MRMRVCVSHTRSQIRTRSDVAGGLHRLANICRPFRAWCGMGGDDFFHAKGAKEGAEIAEVLKIAWVYSGMFFTTELHRVRHRVTRSLVRRHEF